MSARTSFKELRQKYININILVYINKINRNLKQNLKSLLFSTNSNFFQLYLFFKENQFSMYTKYTKIIQSNYKSKHIFFKIYFSSFIWSKKTISILFTLFWLCP